jgi:hypothetical protein
MRKILCVYIYTYIYVHVYIYICTCVYIYIYIMYACMHVCMYVHIYILCVYLWDRSLMVRSIWVKVKRINQNHQHPPKHDKHETWTKLSIPINLHIFVQYSVIDVFGRGSSTPYIPCPSESCLDKFQVSPDRLDRHRCARTPRLVEWFPGVFLLDA